MRLVPKSFHFNWTLSPLKKLFCDTAASKLGTLNILTAAGWPYPSRQNRFLDTVALWTVHTLRSGMKTATE